MNIDNITEQDITDALDKTMDTVDNLCVIDIHGDLVARAGFMLNIVFSDGDTIEVRERFFKLFDHYCSIIPLKEMVWWWDGRPIPFLSDKCKAQLSELKKDAQDTSKYAISFRMGSGIESLKMRGPAIWDENAQGHFLKCLIFHTKEMWIHDRFEPGTGPSPSYARFAFPVSWMRNGGVVSDFVKTAVEIMRPLWATAGWGIASAPDESISKSNEGQQRLYPWLERYAGIDAIDSHRLSNPLFYNAMSSINWVNFVSDHLLDKLGGRQAVLEQIKSSKFLIAKDVGNCLMIQAGLFPSLCDSHSGPPYPTGFGDAARLLKPIRAKGVRNSFVSSKGSDGPDDEQWNLDCEKWFGRFDRFGL